MLEAEKYRLVARSLRDRAISPENAIRRNEVLSLAALFDKLALDAEREQQHEVQILFEGGVAGLSASH